jgi:superfamily II DNA helicase RecQ
MGLKASRVMAGHNYSAQDESMQSPILVMTYDLFATNSRILDRVRTLAYSKNVARIVIDEAHTLITDSAHRENFNRLYSRIAQLSIPLVFLTGTMPPAEVMKFQEMLSAHTICHVIRLPIDIPNLRYSVNRPHATNDNVKKFIQVVKDELLSNLREKTSERAIIFTRTREFAETIAQELEVAYYHSRADADEKQASLSRWLDKQTTLMEHVSRTQLYYTHPYL